ncbi:MAG: NAD(+) synthase [Oscillospiraceae bacterium]|nr:NAD(+) synthase [Oscillospiraceae bacterium]
MKDGIVSAAAGSPRVSLGNPRANAAEIVRLIRAAADGGAAVLVLPELCLTGSTCGDLFFQSALIRGAEEALGRILDETRDCPVLTFVGLPATAGGSLCDCAAVLCGGRLLGVVPRTDFSDLAARTAFRAFSPAPSGVSEISLAGSVVPFGAGLLFSCRSVPGLVAAAGLGGNLWAPVSPLERRALAGATVLAGLSASPELVARSRARRNAALSLSARLVCGCVVAEAASGAGDGESSTDAVFSGQLLICDRGETAAENPPFGGKDLIFSEIDVSHLLFDRRRSQAFAGGDPACRTVEFSLPCRTSRLTRGVAPLPFVPADPDERARRCAEVLEIQTHALARRLGPRFGAVVAVSGGLDSTLALLVTARAFDLLGRPRSEILTVTMPCFGTTARTRGNAEILCEALGTSFRVVDIAEAVAVHFRDIGHDPADRSVTYENAQARERTQIAMDLANSRNAMVVGTGDLSELALGWATYNGDHMSNYAVNGGVPKTLIRAVVAHCAGRARADGETALAAVLEDILATPVSPELLPAENGEIAQKTEDLVGPYELHDFFLYRMVRWGESPRKIYRMAVKAFSGPEHRFEPAVVARWLAVFTRRFFSQQFKRSCMPDGPKIGSVGLSPRGDWQMPSDACAALWTAEAEALLSD